MCKIIAKGILSFMRFPLTCSYTFNRLNSICISIAIKKNIVIKPISQKDSLKLIFTALLFISCNSSWINAGLDTIKGLINLHKYYLILCYYLRFCFSEKNNTLIHEYTVISIFHWKTISEMLLYQSDFTRSINSMNYYDQRLPVCKIVSKILAYLSLSCIFV